MEVAVRKQPLRFPQPARTSAPAEVAIVDTTAAAAGPSAAARRLLAAMLTKSADERATLAVVARHAWVTADGAEPLALPTIGAPLVATPEEVLCAISVRAPALDLASSGALRVRVPSCMLPSARGANENGPPLSSSTNSPVPAVARTRSELAPRSGASALDW